MRIIYLIPFCFLSSFCTYSQDYNFSIGLTYQPYFYQNYNKSDWNNRPESYPDNPGKFNGKAFGLVLNKPITDHFSIKMEITYSIQYQKNTFVSYSRFGPDNQTLIYYYGKNAVTHFKIFKMPVLSSLTYEIGYNSGLFINWYLGPQFSFIEHYNSTFKGYAFEYVNEKIDLNFQNNLIVYTPEHFEQTVWDGSLDPPGFQDYSGKTPYLYNRWLFGGLGGFEFQKKISSHFLFSLGGRIEYDFTNSENHIEFLFPEMAGVGHNGPRAKSHNVRYGLSFSVMYLFDLR